MQFIKLELLEAAHGTELCTYDPELFPSLIYRSVEPKVVLLMFVSGKVVVTGAKCKDDIDTVFKRIYPVLRSFRKA